MVYIVKDNNIQWNALVPGASNVLYGVQKKSTSFW